MAAVTPLERLKGKYEILEKLQEGGMGAVYKVRHRLLGEERVVKVMRPHLQQDETLRTRFLQEAQAAARLSHPNIARIFDFTFDEDGVAYIVMEFIPGATLGDLVRAGERPPLSLALEIAKQSLKAIGYIHRQQIVHRDVAPDNLMLCRDEEGGPRVKLIDLGLAKAIEGDDSQLTGAGVFVGKFRYAAPEHFEAASGAELPFSADLYAFALVLYELLTGKYPISGDNPSSLIAGHLFRPPMDFAASDPEDRLPETLRRALLRGLAKAPEERFATAEEFLATLSEVEFEGDPAEVERILAWTQSPPEALKIPAGGPGSSTQARFDRSFLPEPTPLPSGAAGSLQWIDPEQETVVLPPTPGGGSALAPPPPSPEPTAVEEIASAVEEIEEAIGEGELSAARERLREAEAVHGRDPRLQELSERISEIEEIANRPVVRGLLERAQTAAGQDRHREALELLDRAWELAPGDPQVVSLRTIEQQLLRQEEERDERRRLIAERAQGISTLLDGGRLDDAAVSLDRAVETFGPDPKWNELQARIEELRGHETVVDLGAQIPTSLPPLLPVGGEGSPAPGAESVEDAGVDELLASAHRKAQNEDFASAKTLLEKILEREPDHREARATLASVKACLQVRDEEVEQTAEIERTVTDLREMLQTGHSEAAVAVLDRAQTAFGAHKELVGMRFEVARARLDDEPASPEPGAPPSTTMLSPSMVPPPIPDVSKVPSSSPVSPAPPVPPAPPVAVSAETSVVTGEPSPTPSTAFQVPGHSLVETMAEIEKQTSVGKMGRALEILQQAVQEFGQVPELREARSRLSLLLLDHDADQNAASARVDPFGTVPSLKDPARGIAADRPVAPAGGPPPSAAGGSVFELTLDGRSSLPTPTPPTSSTPGPAPATGPSLPSNSPHRSHGGLELDTGFRTTTELSSGAQRKALPSEPGGRHLGKAALAVALLLALGLGLNFLNRSADLGEGEVPGEESAAVDLPPGLLHFDAVPWAEIVSLTDGAGEEVPITPSRYTPVVLHLSPGAYRLVVKDPSTEEVQELDLEIVSGETVERRSVFREVEGGEYFSAMGW